MGLRVTRGGEVGTTDVFESGPEILASPQSSQEWPAAPTRRAESSPLLPLPGAGTEGRELSSAAPAAPRAPTVGRMSAPLLAGTSTPSWAPVTQGEAHQAEGSRQDTLAGWEEGVE